MATSYEQEKLKFISKLKSKQNIDRLSIFIKFKDNLSPTLNFDEYIIKIIDRNVIPMFLSSILIFDDVIFEICNDYIKKNFYNLYVMYMGATRVRFNQPMVNTKVSISDIEDKLKRENTRTNIICDVNKYNRITL